MANNKVTYELIHDTMHEVITGLRNDTMKPAKAKELNNACGKVLSAGLGRLQFAIKTGANIEIPELGIGDMELIAIQENKKETKKLGYYEKSELERK